MNDQQPQAQPAPDPDPPSELNVAPKARREPAEAPKFEAPKGNPDSGRYAAYDTTLGKYVGGTHDSEAKARKAGKDSGAESYKVVEV